MLWYVSFEIFDLPAEWTLHVFCIRIKFKVLLESNIVFLKEAFSVFTSFNNRSINPTHHIQGHDISEWNVWDEIRPWKISSWQERFLVELSRPSSQWKSFCKKVKTDWSIVRNRNQTVNEFSYCSSVRHCCRCSRGSIDGSHASKNAGEESKKKKMENYDFNTRGCWSFPRKQN